MLQLHSTAGIVVQNAASLDPLGHATLEGTTLALHVQNASSPGEHCYQYYIMSVFYTIYYYSHCSYPSLDICRYEAGLQKLLAAEGEVNVMKEELIQLQPKLIATGKQVEETLVVVNSQTEAAVAQKAVVSAEEAAASETAAAAKAIKVCCTSCWQHTVMFLKNWLMHDCPGAVMQSCQFRLHAFGNTLSSIVNLDGILYQVLILYIRTLQ